MRHWFEYNLFSIICPYFPVDETCFIKLFIKHGAHLDVFYQKTSYASATSNFKNIFKKRNMLLRDGTLTDFPIDVNKVNVSFQFF